MQWNKCATNLACRYHDRQGRGVIKPGTPITQLPYGAFECEHCTKFKNEYIGQKRAAKHAGNWDEWFQKLQAEPRKPHPTHYLQHTPFSKPCGCTRCQGKPDEWSHS